MDAFIRGVESGAFTLLFGAVLRGISGFPFLPELVARRLFELVPIYIFEYYISVMGPAARWVALAGTLVCTLLIFGQIGRWAVQLGLRNGTWPSWAVATSVLALTGIGVGLPLLGADPWTFHPRSTLPTFVGVILTSGAYFGWYLWGARLTWSFGSRR